MPRWWLEMDYKPIVRDADGLVWKIDGSAKAMTETAYIDKDGSKKPLGDSPISKKWAENFTDHYDELSRKLPVFAELRNCMDLAVLGALIARYNLDEISDFESRLLRDETNLPNAKFNVPKKTEPQMTYMRKNRNWIFSVSGGVDVNCWLAVSNPQTDDTIAQRRLEAQNSRGDRWWWD